MDKDLQIRATDYAKCQLAKQEEISIWRSDVFYLIREAYKQGWVDRDAKDIKPETEEEFFNRE